jgi:hypothetical protein
MWNCFRDISLGTEKVERRFAPLADAVTQSNGRQEHEKDENTQLHLGVFTQNCKSFPRFEAFYGLQPQVFK